MAYGLFSFMMANVAGFSVATQAYGDFFILLILSWTLGFLFAAPVLVEREVSARSGFKGAANDDEPGSIWRANTIYRAA
jgi:hypothetical protein